MKYVFRKGSQAKGDPQVVAEELERISKQHGNLVPSIVVEEARPKDAPLHPQFEWRNSAAAQLYREYQARNLIRSVRVIVDETQEAESSLPVYVHVRSGEQINTGDETETVASGAYYNVAVAVRNVDMWTQVIRETNEKLTGIERSLEDLARIEAGQRQRIARNMQRAVHKASEIGHQAVKQQI